MNGTLAIVWARAGRQGSPSSDRKDGSPSSREPNLGGVRGSALVVTNLTKLGGLVLAVHEALIRTELRPGVLAIAAFMMAGAQGLETLVDRLLGR